MCIRCASGFTGEVGQAQGSPRNWGQRRKGNLKFELVVGKKGDGCNVRLKRKSYGKTWQLAVAVKKKKQKKGKKGRRRS